MAEQLAQNYVMTGGTTMATPSANVQKKMDGNALLRLVSAKEAPVRNKDEPGLDTVRDADLGSNLFRGAHWAHGKNSWTLAVAEPSRIFPLIARQPRWRLLGLDPKNAGVARHA